MAVQLFLSCVSDEFGVYRDELRRKLTRPNVEIKIQEDFKALGGDTLMKLEAYIDGCEAIVHFVGDMTGSAPPDHCVAELLVAPPRFENAPSAARRGARSGRGGFLYAMGGVARALPSQGPGDRRVRSGRRARSEIRPDNWLRGCASGPSEATARSRPIPGSHVRRRERSGRANPRLGGHRCAGQGGGHPIASTARPAFRLAWAPVHGPRKSARSPARGARRGTRGGGDREGAARARRRRQDAVRDRICAAARGGVFGVAVRARRRSRHARREPGRARRRRRSRSRREGCAARTR